MFKPKGSRKCIGLAFALSLVIASAAVAAQRTFVSAGSGSDANPCTRQQPCRNFAAAIVHTDAGGEVVVLDSGGYGALTINQSVSVISPLGVYAGVTGFSGTAIEIDAGGAIVVLKGLFLNAQGGTTGINVADAFAVHIENVVIHGFSGHGLDVSDYSQVFVKNSIVRNCGGSGIFLSSGITSVDGTHLDMNGSGLIADGADVRIRDTVAARNQGGAFRFRNGATASIENATSSDAFSTSIVGFLAELGAEVTIRNSASIRDSVGFKSQDDGTVLTIDACLASGGAHGFLSESGSLLTVSNSTAVENFVNGIVAGTGGTVRAFGNVVTKNGVGLNGGSGTFESAGHNLVKGNATETLGTITPIPTM
jgi:parallel beta helix pectate lyase-like protein